MPLSQLHDSLTDRRLYEEREITFALWQHCPGPIPTRDGGSPSHLKTLPALIASTLRRQIP